MEEFEEEEMLTVKEVSEDSTSGSRILIIVVSFLMVILLVVYFGWIFSITNFQHEFPKLTGVGPPPQNFEDRRYDWRWWVMAVAAFNIFIPTMMMWMLRTPKLLSRIDLVSVVLVGMFVLTVLVGIALVIMWCTANSQFYPQNIANAFEYCCQFFGSFPLICRNNAVCIDFPMPVSLSINPVFAAHLVSILIMIVFVGLLLVLTSALRSYTMMSMLA